MAPATAKPAATPGPASSTIPAAGPAAAAPAAPNTNNTEPNTAPAATPTAVATAPAVPANAVTQGSFTIWAVPANPAPYQPYTIYTQVKLPSATPNYAITDLSGHLVGTDGYTQQIGGTYGHQQFQYSGGTTALMMTEVPGTYNGVHDTIEVASALLNEQQTIKLTFGTSSGTAASGSNPLSSLVNAFGGVSN